MEGIKRTNAVVVREAGQEQGAGIPPRWDPYIIEVDRGRNCYACIFNNVILFKEICNKV